MFYYLKQSADEYILTAAHCADGFSSFEVVIGAHEVRNPDEEGHVETTTRTAFVHPEWDSFNLANDMSILKVPKITFNGKIYIWNIFK